MLLELAKLQVKLYLFVNSRKNPSVSLPLCGTKSLFRKGEDVFLGERYRLVTANSLFVLYWMLLGVNSDEPSRTTSCLYGQWLVDQGFRNPVPRPALPP